VVNQKGFMCILLLELGVRVRVRVGVRGWGTTGLLQAETILIVPSRFQTFLRSPKYCSQCYLVAWHVTSKVNKKRARELFIHYQVFCSRTRT
jgi:hypothetical protein